MDRMPPNFRLRTWLNRPRRCEACGVDVRDDEAYFPEQHAEEWIARNAW